MIFQILMVLHCVMCTMKNLVHNALYMTVWTTDLETPLHVKHIRQSGENLQNIKLVKLDQVFGECYKGLGKLKPEIHKEEDQTHSATWFIVDTFHYITHHVTDFLSWIYCNPSPVDGSAPNLVIIEYDDNGCPHARQAFNTQVEISTGSYTQYCFIIQNMSLLHRNRKQSLRRLMVMMKTWV